MSEVLTEILRVDPAFDKDRFLRQCEKDIIPNVLEVCAVRGPSARRCTPGPEPQPAPGRVHHQHGPAQQTPPQSSEA